MHPVFLFFREVAIMLGFLTRNRPKAVPPFLRRGRLFLERLETRDCPSVLTMSATYEPQQHVLFSGHVSDTGSTAGLTVQISGAASGKPTTDANGNFSIDLVAAQLGNVQGQTADGKSNVVQITLASQAPQIVNFGVVEGPGGYFTFSGRVVAPSYQGLTVSFGGDPASLQGQTAQVDANGVFQITIKLSGTTNDNGTAIVTATNWWGQSTEAYCDVYQTVVTNGNLTGMAG
jgi:hypothetical protein